MAIEITFLGTSSMVPTKERNVQSIYLEYKGEGILIDCGEGTQRQMNIAGINRFKVKKVLISHWHGDHVSGLIGLIQTLGAKPEADHKLQIYGPKGTKEKMEHQIKSCIFDTKRMKLEINEFNPKKNEIIKVCEGSGYQVEAAYLEHSVPCFGYSFKEKNRLRINTKKAKELGLKEGPKLGKLQKGETITHKGKKITPEQATYEVKGKKISFILDTEICDSAFKLAENADVLISESCYESSLGNKAEEYGHMTAKGAAEIANRANAKKLVLTHFSQRYKTTKPIVQEAKTYFENTEAAYDFMKLKV